MTFAITGVMKIEMTVPAAAMISIDTKNTFPDRRCCREPLGKTMAAAPETSASIPIEMWAYRRIRCVVVMRDSYANPIEEDAFLTLGGAGEFQEWRPARAQAIMPPR